MDARIIKQPHITHNEWNHITFTYNDVLNWKCGIYFIFIFRKQ